MKHSVSELVDVILGLIQDQPDHPVSENRLRSWLTRQGYAKGDIDAAIEVARSRFAPEAQVTDHQPGATRTYTLHEEYKLTPEARDALALIEMYGLIAPHERELVLNHLGHFDGEIGLDELDFLLSWLVCGGRDVEFQQTLANVLDGKGDALH